MSSYFVHCVRKCSSVSSLFLFLLFLSFFLRQPGLSVPTHLYGQAVLTESLLCQRGSQILALLLTCFQHLIALFCISNGYSNRYSNG